MNTVVYYPYISPRPDWLVRAALCWDKVYRLVPSYGSPDDSDGVNELNEALGGNFLESVDVAKVASPEVQSQFWRWVDAREKELKQQRLSPERSNAQEAVSGLFLGKLRGDFIEKLERRGLTRMETEHESMIYLPEDITRHYLSACASKAAEDAKSDLVADGAKFTDIVVHDYSVRGEVDTAILEACLPRDLSTLKPERIAEFRSEFRGQRLEYQTTIQEVVDRYSKVSSEGELENLKETIVDIAKARIDETKKTYRRAKLEIVVETIGVSLTPPATATFVASALGMGILGPIGIASALSLFGVVLLLEWDKARSERAMSPWSYMLEAGRLTS